MSLDFIAVRLVFILLVVLYGIIVIDPDILIGVFTLAALLSTVCDQRAANNWCGGCARSSNGRRVQNDDSSGFSDLCTCTDICTCTRLNDNGSRLCRSRSCACLVWPNAACGGRIDAKIGVSFGS